MAEIRQVDSSAKERLKHQTKGYQEREPYRQAVSSLTPNALIELEPDAGETLRKVKLNLARAAKEVGRAVSYGETQQNTVLAWLSSSDSSGRRRRGPGRPKSGNGRRARAGARRAS